MKNLIITIALVSIWGMSFAKGGDSTETKNNSSNDQTIIIENWMLQPNWFSTDEQTISIEDVQTINLNIATEEELEIESWMFDTTFSSICIESQENNLEIENWMFSTKMDEQENELQLEKWMF